MSQDNPKPSGKKDVSGSVQQEGGAKTIDLRALSNVFLYFSIFSAVAVALYSLSISLQAFATSFVWTSACWIVGVSFGFLFGFPKAIQNDDATAQKGNVLYRMLINNNLGEISDWLTKIIVGLSLVHVQNLESALSKAG